MITVDLVRRLVSTQFPQWADLPIAPVPQGGVDNRTFRLGADMSVRLPSHARYAEQVAKEHRWLPVLAPALPLPIPQPLAKGHAVEGYPHSWSIYRWLDGAPAELDGIKDVNVFATELADFLVALRRIDPSGGPAPGTHNFFRGGPLATYDREARAAIDSLGRAISGGRATAVWETALHAVWSGPPVWVHGDVASGNLLVRHGRLSAVIDFGSSGVGDPACDTTIAWTLLDHASRATFRKAVGLDEGTWARGRGWALWKALITIAGADPDQPAELEPVASARRVLDRVLEDHERSG